MSLEAGTQLGDYRVLSRIGTGAYGEVYEGEHVITRRRDAIKVLVNARLHIAEEEQRFLREIQVQASLHHPNIAAVYNAFSTPHGLALVMELIPGEPLSAILARGRVPLHRGIGILLEMLAGLSYAHAEGVVHRDIKPENIIVSPDGSVKLTDFGLALSVTSPRLTQSGVCAGSPCYMSPEQARGTSTADSRSDTYSAGVVLYEIVTGQLPFLADSAFEVLMAHQNFAPPPPLELEPTIGTELNQVILAALEKEPDKRFQTACAFYAALQHVVASAAPAPQIAPAINYRPKRLSLAAVVCFILAAGTYASVVLNPRSPPPVASRRGKDSSAAAQHALVAQKGESGPVSSPAPTEVTSTPDSNPPALPQRNLPPRVRNAVLSPPAGLRITGSLPDAQIPLAVPAAIAAEPPEISLPATLVAPEPEPNSPPAVKADPAKGSPPKRRNVVVRALQKVFHPRRETAYEPAPQAGETSPIRPGSRTDPAKQP
jgi:eukaryotic-like serine/threonine-protein kinase